MEHRKLNREIIKKALKKRWVIGIDEAGRGPLAGPVSVGVVLIPGDFNWDLLKGVNDSKQVSEKNREIIYREAMVLAKAGKLFCTVEMVGASFIDKRGIVTAIKSAIEKGLKTVLADGSDTLSTKSTRRDLVQSKGKGAERGSRELFEGGLAALKIRADEVKVKLDGGLKAPAEFLQQETIVKGDAKEKVIGLASILAKVTRDYYMVKLGQKPAYQKYHFARHKGYGTPAHRTAIAKHGLSPEHRDTFCKNKKSVV